MKKRIYYTIHGHFYQPPRENPWTEAIEYQESAHPSHDWNERIFRECYHPNSRARVLDEQGLVGNIVNNFEKISFNFGPTLLSWLESYSPDTLAAIVEADRQSIAKNQGHGNALAQVYNHMIMPLANHRDKVTQVRWGIEEFKTRFGRMPEGMWLPETACNDETLEVLVEENIRFTILSPHQAKRFRPFEDSWQDVQQGTIDPKKPYRYFLKKDPSKYIDLFFYDGGISKAVAFDDLLFDAKHLMKSLSGAVAHDYPTSQLIHIATDGESFGHHKAFGDRVIAYFTQIEAPHHHFKSINYGAFLEENPPVDEVEIKEGESGEGTSWSCAHGVARWKEHCGCRGDGPADWNQHWRGPLRRSLDWLRDELATIFESVGSGLLKNVWDARDDYIGILLNRDSSNIADFLIRHGSRPLNEEEQIRALKLLEMQRHAMLMYTSCGWFFTELSGIETVQILQYASRATQLAEEITGRQLEEIFLKQLESAKSNVPFFADGRGVYERFVRPSIATLEKIVSYYAIGSVFEDYYPNEEALDIYCYRFEILHSKKEDLGGTVVHFGRVRITSKITFEKKDLLFVVVQVGLYDFHSSIRPFESQEQLSLIESELFRDIQEGHILELLKKIHKFFGETYFTLKDLLVEDRKKIIAILTHEQISKVSDFYEKIYDENRRMNAIYHSINLPIPQEFRYVAEHVLSKRIMQEVEQLSAEGFPLKKASQATRLMETAKELRVTFDRNPVTHFLSGELKKRIGRLVENPSAELLQECLDIHRIADRMDLKLHTRNCQDLLFSKLRDWEKSPDSVPETIREQSYNFTKLLEEFELSDKIFRTICPA